ncbi:MAG: short-chain dehydrogenase [Bradyrhizobiaceae bacterium]|nr:MAG: short-chain dehydrogenase [Bradyrhizobiaceae bacterium]
MTRFGRSDDDLAAMPLTFRDGLFADRVVLVSGSGRGIGKAIAFQFARLGAKVALCGRDEARLAATAGKLAALGAEALAHPMSIRDPDAVSRLYDAVWQRFGTLDVLVNNAGGQFPQAAIDFSVKGWNAVIDTNLNGTWYMMQQAARRWRDAGRGGAIVNIVTVIDRGMPGVAHTCAARAGVIYLSKTVAIEWAPLGIRINCVAPGAIATEGMEVYPDEARAAFPRSNLMKRFGDVRDIADAVCYLAGPSGEFMTGEVVTVDGGNHVWGDQWTIPRPAWFEE